MKKISPNLLLLLTFFILGSVSGSLNNFNNLMPVTSVSEKAVKLYYEGVKAMENAENKKAAQLLDEALEIDSCFFMAGFQRIMFDIYEDNQQELKIHIENVLKSDSKLSVGEKVLKDALNNYKINPGTALSQAAKKLIQLYPEDIDAWYILASLQALEKKYEESLFTFQKIINISDEPAPFYNQIGYLNMYLEKYEAAEKAFDKYIELNPDHPNPWDSKGDFYMHIEEYGQAYCSYMKAHELNANWSYSKAMQAKWKSISRKY